MKILTFFGFLFISFIGVAQDDLFFMELGSDPAYCRVFSYQSGNGVVYAAVGGGTPDYTYQWRDLTTEETVTNSTWGGRNPGDYEITITDDAGAVLIDTITVDSLNPVADFDVISDDLTPIAWGYTGDAPAEVSFSNTSMYFANPAYPDSDTSFFFRPQGFEPWTHYTDYDSFEDYTYIYGGVFTASLVALNKNGCTDTTHKTIGLFGPVGIEDNPKDAAFTITTHTLTNTVTLRQTGFEEGLILRLYSTSGQFIQEITLTDFETVLTLDLPRGIYIYEAIDKATGQLATSDKITF